MKITDAEMIDLRKTSKKKNGFRGPPNCGDLGPRDPATETGAHGQQHRSSGLTNGTTGLHLNGMHTSSQGQDAAHPDAKHNGRQPHRDDGTSTAQNGLNHRDVGTDHGTMDRQSRSTKPENGTDTDAISQHNRSSKTDNGSSRQSQRPSGPKTILVKRNQQHPDPSKNPSDWSPTDVKLWLQMEGFQDFWPFLEPHQPTGIDLLMLEPDDWQNIFRESQVSHLEYPSVILVKRLFYRVNKLKMMQKSPALNFCLSGNPVVLTTAKPFLGKQFTNGESHSTDEDIELEALSNHQQVRKVSIVDSSEEFLSIGGGGGIGFHPDRDETETDLDDDEGDERFITEKLKNSPCPFCHNQLKREKEPILPERWKALLAFGYSLVVSWVTAFVMVIVHGRVPDMEKYPPLPDILLDNIPHIPWAFEMCEFTGMILMCLWGLVLVFHKHRFILMRRFFSISGTIFLLRCVTMLITSLSVPGKHLDCSPRPYGDIWNKLYNAYVIWTGAGMTLQGVRTCGDYMFSGHTVALTLLNFFITEYTSRKIYFLHTLTWICNVFGIFFILAAHEHYSIDVFVAFYITSRLFMYYHTLANQPATHNPGKKSTPTIGHFSYDAHRVWLWFPLFSFFESRIDGKIPNEFELPISFTDISDAIRKIVETAKSFRELIRQAIPNSSKEAATAAALEASENNGSKKSDKSNFFHGKSKKQKKLLKKE